MDIELNKKQNTRGCVKVERWDTTEGLKHYLGVNVICMFESIFSDGPVNLNLLWIIHTSCLRNVDMGIWPIVETHRYSEFMDYFFCEQFLSLIEHW